ncbi:hypothetical protein ACQRBF_03095 [Peptoniphilaceae bacterium SGI.131]
MKRLITAQDVYEAKACGKIYIDKNTLITPQARDIARDNKVEFVEADLCHADEHAKESHVEECKDHGCEKACYDDHCHEEHSHEDHCHEEHSHEDHSHVEYCKIDSSVVCGDGETCDRDCEKPLSCQEIYDFLNAAIASHIFTEEELMEKLRGF